MNDLLSRPYLLLLISLTALFAAYFTIIDIPDILIDKNKGENTKESRISTESFDIIDQALKESVPHTFYTYIGDFENPFRRKAGIYTTKKSNVTKKTAQIDRIKLQLKGILSKEQPLAILEDERGVSYICSVGDSVGNQVVTAIKGSNVVITDSKGKYEITVEEE